MVCEDLPSAQVKPPHCVLAFWQKEWGISVMPFMRELNSFMRDTNIQTFAPGIPSTHTSTFRTVSGILSMPFKNVFCKSREDNF
jgi:hypothetical protein